MYNKNYYDILWINKNSSEAEIKKAFRKKAMEHHPDRHKGDKKSEEKFKEINEAYQVLSDPSKKKQYDTFWSYNDQFNSYWWWQQHSWYEDIFSNFKQWSRNTNNQSFNFDNLEDIFSNMFWWNQKTYHTEETNKQPKSNYEKQNLDVIKNYEIPIIDLLLWTKINIQTVYNENLKLKIPESTKPWTKFKIKWKWRKIGKEIWDMYVIVDVKMPKKIPEDIKKLLESIKYRL